MTYFGKSLPRPLWIVGYTTRQHLCLDLDDVGAYDAVGLALMLMSSYPEVGDILLITSSIREKEGGTRIDRKGRPHHRFRSESMHLVTNNNIGYERCMYLFGVLVDLNILPSIYRRIRMFRNDMTLRVSPSLLSNIVKEQPMPWIYIFNTKNSHRDYMIKQYLRFWRATGNLFLTHNETKQKTYNAYYCTYHSSSDSTVNIMQQCNYAVGS